MRFDLRRLVCEQGEIDDRIARGVCLTWDLSRPVEVEIGSEISLRRLLERVPMVPGYGQQLRLIQKNRIIQSGEFDSHEMPRDLRIKAGDVIYVSGRR
jgi:hypothetical protein